MIVSDYYCDVCKIVNNVFAAYHVLFYCQQLCVFCGLWLCCRLFENLHSYVLTSTHP